MTRFCKLPFAPAAPSRSTAARTLCAFPINRCFCDWRTLSAVLASSGCRCTPFPPYQACVIAVGAELGLDAKGLIAIDHFTMEGFRRLLALHHLRPDRPGDLSARERTVVELSAVGKTANEIASVLKISQRTVHATCRTPARNCAPATRPRRCRGPALRSD